MRDIKLSDAYGANIINILLKNIQIVVQYLSGKCPSPLKIVFCNVCACWFSFKGQCRTSRYVIAVGLSEGVPLSSALHVSACYCVNKITMIFSHSSSNFTGILSLCWASPLQKQWLHSARHTLLEFSVDRPAETEWAALCVSRLFSDGITSLPHEIPDTSTLFIPDCVLSWHLSLFHHSFTIFVLEMFDFGGGGIRSH